MPILSFGSPPSPPSTSRSSSRQSQAATGPHAGLALPDSAKEKLPGRAFAAAMAAAGAAASTSTSSSSLNPLVNGNAASGAASAPMDLVPSTSTGSLLASQTLDRAMAAHTLQDHNMKRKLKRNRRYKRPVLHSRLFPRKRAERH